MICYQKIKNKPKVLQSITGLTTIEIETLLLSFEIIWRTNTENSLPDGKKRKRAWGAGKKKRHTVKNNLITDRQGKILFLSKTAEGKKHDKKLADEENYQFPWGSKLWKDTGYQGYEPFGVRTFQPKKKPKGGELTSSEKEKNKEIAKERIEIEHNISGVKRSKIVSEIFRNRKDLFVDVVMETACGLHNFRTSQRSQKLA